MTLDYHHLEPIPVGIRGAGGLLGHRLLRTLLVHQKDVSVSSVVLGTDEVSFRRFQSVMQAVNPHEPIQIFIDATRQKIQQLMEEWQSPWTLYPLDQAWGDLQKAHAIVDTAVVSGKDHMESFYEAFADRKPVVFQSGTYPRHCLVTPPFSPRLPNEKLLFRQGDCLLSGMAPILFPLRESIRRIDLHLLVQRQKPLNDYTLRDHLDDVIVNPSLENRVKKEVSELFPHMDEDDVEMSVVEVPGHDYYLCEFKLELTESMTREDFLEKLRDAPRLFIAPPEIPISTGQVQQRLREPYQEIGKPLQPIVIFSGPGAIEVKGKNLKFRATFYSKAITMLPNVDTVRALVRDISMKQSMEITDRYCFGLP